MKLINANKLHRKPGVWGTRHLMPVGSTGGLDYVSLRLVWGLCAFLPRARLERLL